MSRTLPILMYHHVSSSPGLVTVAPEHFRAQMRWLAERGYRALGGDDLARFVAGENKGAESSRQVLISFDDGYLDNYVHAYPILREYGLRAVLFGVTGWIGDGAARPLAGEAGAPPTPSHRECQALINGGRADEAVVRWSEIERMLADGTFELHSHTHSHKRWDKLCSERGEKSARLAEDLAASRQTLQARLGRASGHLCWPQGYYDDDYRAVATAAGFTHLYTTQPGTLCAGDDPQHLPRVVTKDRDATWLAGRMRIYRSPALARFYGWLKDR